MNFSKFAIAVFVFALLTTIGAKISVPAGIISFTLQTIFVMLAGLIAGANAGFTSQLVYLLFGMFAPVFAGQMYGPGVFSDVSAGYLIAFPLAALLCGKYGHKVEHLGRLIWVTILAQTLIYFFGVMGMIFNSSIGFDLAIRFGFFNLAPIGYLKAIITAFLYHGYQRISNKKN